MRDGVRWIADVTYASTAGDVDVRHHIEELDELQDLIERGPDWHCIKDIRVTLLRKDGEQPMTLETAESQ